MKAALSDVRPTGYSRLSLRENQGLEESRRGPFSDASVIHDKQPHILATDTVQAIMNTDCPGRWGHKRPPTSSMIIIQGGPSNV